MAKMSSGEIVRIALIWAEENMRQMIDACEPDDEYRADVIDQLRQLKAYHKRRFGTPPDPFKGASLVGIEELRVQNKQAGLALTGKDGSAAS